MLFDLWMLTRTFTPDIGSAPSPDGPPHLATPDLGSEPPPSGPPPR